MKKKIFVMSLATVMSLSLLTGCTGKEQNDTDTSEATVSNLYTSNTAATDGKLAVNFEGRVAAIEGDKVTLEDGTVVLIDGANISASDGSSVEIAVGDYIQGYAEDPNAAELNATAILITIL